MKRFFASLCLLMASQTNAGQINNGTISGLVVDSLAMVRVSLSGGTEISSQTQCSSASNNRQYIFSVDSPAGKAWYTGLQSAMNQQKKVHIIGTGNSCLQLWGDTAYEAVSSIYLLPN